MPPRKRNVKRTSSTKSSSSSDSKDASLTSDRRLVQVPKTNEEDVNSPKGLNVATRPGVRQMERQSSSRNSKSSGRRLSHKSKSSDSKTRKSFTKKTSNHAEGAHGTASEASDYSSSSSTSSATHVPDAGTCPVALKGEKDRTQIQMGNKIIGSSKGKKSEHETEPVMPGNTLLENTQSIVASTVSSLSGSQVRKHGSELVPTKTGHASAVRQDMPPAVTNPVAMKELQINESSKKDARGTGKRMPAIESLAPKLVERREETSTNGDRTPSRAEAGALKKSDTRNAASVAGKTRSKEKSLSPSNRKAKQRSRTLQNKQVPGRANVEGSIPNISETPKLISGTAYGEQVNEIENRLQEPNSEALARNSPGDHECGANKFSDENEGESDDSSLIKTPSNGSNSSTASASHQRPTRRSNSDSGNSRKTAWKDTRRRTNWLGNQRSFKTSEQHRIQSSGQHNVDPDGHSGISASPADRPGAQEGNETHSPRDPLLGDDGSSEVQWMNLEESAKNNAEARIQGQEFQDNGDMDGSTTLDINEEGQGVEMPQTPHDKGNGYEEENIDITAPSEITSSSAKCSTRRTKKMLSPLAKVFTPGKYGASNAKIVQNPEPVRPKPYFLPMQQFVSVGRESAPLLVNQWPQVQAIEQALNAKPGYWYMDGRRGVVIPGLEAYPPAELAQTGAIIPVPWLPVE